jgi:hypothetical protein
VGCESKGNAQRERGEAKATIVDKIVENRSVKAGNRRARQSK